MDADLLAVQGGFLEPLFPVIFFRLFLLLPLQRFIIHKEAQGDIKRRRPVSYLPEQYIILTLAFPEKGDNVT